MTYSWSAKDIVVLCGGTVSELAGVPRASAPGLISTEPVWLTQLLDGMWLPLISLT